MTTATTFSRQNGVGSSARALDLVNWENIALAVVLALECKALY